MIIVVDTSSVIHHPELFAKSYLSDTIVVPLTVIRELDNLKTGNDATAVSARKALSVLDDLRSHSLTSQQEHALSEENIEETELVVRASIMCDVYSRDCHGNVIVGEFTHREEEFSGFSSAKMDNDIAIISAALSIDKSDSMSNVVLVTQDRSMSIISGMVGISAEQHVTVPSGIGGGVISVSGKPGSVQEMYSKGSTFDASFLGHSVNTGVILTDGNSSALGIISHDGRAYKARTHLSPCGVRPQDAQQTIAIDLMMGSHKGEYKNEFLGALSGRSGSGKTTIALAVGIEGVKNGMYDRVMVFRPAEPVGKDIGFLPGTIEEKMAPWGYAVEDVLRDINVPEHITREFHDYDRTHQQALAIKDVVSVENINFVRGRTFTNTFVIVDEAQNLTVTELRTLASRCGRGTAFVCTFDPSQIDNPYLRNGRAEGVEEFLSNVLHSPSAFHIKLNNPIRGGVSALIS